jgi:hypothetical protein
VTAAEIAEILSKLKVGKGGKGQSVRLCGDYRIGFFEHRSEEQPYQVILYKGAQERRIGLRHDDVFSKSRTRWRRDGVWRMKPETVQAVAGHAAKAISCPVRRS